MGFAFSPCSPCTCVIGVPRISFNYCNNVLASGHLNISGSGYTFNDFLDASGSYIASGILPNQCYSGLLSVEPWGNFTTNFCISSGTPIRDFNVVYGQSDKFSCCFPCSLPISSGLLLDITGPFGQDVDTFDDESNGFLTITREEHISYVPSLSGVNLSYISSGTLVEGGVTYVAPYFISEPVLVGSRTLHTVNIDDEPAASVVYRMVPGVCSGVIIASHFYSSDINDEADNYYRRFLFTCNISGVASLRILYEQDFDASQHSTLLTWTRRDVNTCPPPSDTTDTFDGYDTTTTQSSGIVSQGYNLLPTYLSAYCKPFDLMYSHNGLYIGGGGSPGIASVYEPQ
jgi:hypothetical protein